MIIQKKCLYLLLLFIPTFLFAESSEIKWQWEGYHAIKITTSTTINDNSTHFSIGELYVQLPLFMGKKDYFGAGVNYKLLASELPKDSESNYSNLVRGVVAYNRSFSDKLHLYAEYNGGVNGVWDSIEKSNSHLAFSYFGYKQSKNIYFRGGVALSYEFQEVTPYPILGASVGITNKFGIDLLVPSHFLIRYKISPKLELGTLLKYNSASAGFKNSEENILVYSYSYLSSSIYFDYRLYKDFILRINSGGYFVRDINIKDLNSENELKPITNNAPFIELTLRLQV